jgi:hypothetical protein
LAAEISNDDGWRGRWEQWRSEIIIFFSVLSPKILSTAKRKGFGKNPRLLEFFWEKVGKIVQKSNGTFFCPSLTFAFRFFSVLFVVEIGTDSPRQELILKEIIGCRPPFGANSYFV